MSRPVARIYSCRLEQVDSIKEIETDPLVYSTKYHDELPYPIALYNGKHELVQEHLGRSSTTALLLRDVTRRVATHKDDRAIVIKGPNGTQRCVALAEILGSTLYSCGLDVTITHVRLGPAYGSHLIHTPAAPLFIDAYRFKSTNHKQQFLFAHPGKFSYACNVGTVVSHHGMSDKVTEDTPYDSAIVEKAYADSWDLPNYIKTISNEVQKGNHSRIMIWAMHPQKAAYVALKVSEHLQAINFHRPTVISYTDLAQNPEVAA